MSTTNTTSTALQFHLPANTASVRENVRASIELLGKARRATFSFYPRKEFYRVAVQSKGWGMLLIGKTAKGWQAKHFTKVAHGTWAFDGVESKVHSAPEAAYNEIVVKWAPTAKPEALNS